MNFSFDESGGMGSKAHSEENFNLLCFLVLSSKIINCDTLFEFSSSKQHLYYF